MPLGIFILPILCVLGSFDGFAQERCGTVAYEKLIHGDPTSNGRESRFEQWMRDKITANRTRTLQTNRIESFTYTIPVVVHVIHNGEALGTGTNISDAQIVSQIQVLNDDYKRLNADASNTPAEFLPFAGSIDMQFVLAQQDPEGLPTSGITRTKGTKTSWTLTDNSEFKSLAYWPAENYLNIWVINFATSTGLLGYSQLPTIDPSIAGGLDDSSHDRLTDGVAINYKDFGSGSGFNLDAAYNKGRTATHEVGHFFGLRHIWGDSNCATDYVADTPTQPNSTTGCPTNPTNVTCSDGTHHKMFQNYMDYTNDVCMNLFTKNQVDRMVVILQNSPRRTSLLTSTGADPAVTVANDAGIRQVTAPQASACSGSIIPQIEIKNYGNNNVTSVQVQVSVNSVVTETKTFAVNLTPLQSTLVSFNNTLVLVAGSTQTISFSITSTNSPSSDGKGSNNTLTQTVTVPASTALPVLESFNSVPSGWQIINPDGLITWANILAPDAIATNRAMYLDFHDYDNQGTDDWLVSPSFTLSNPLTSQMKFNRAYAQYPGETGDELMVYALPTCSHDLSQGILLFDASGSTLATASSTSADFAPSAASQWKTEVKSLSTLSSSISYQIAFVGKNGWGNNLYIDTIVISDQEVNDVGITGIVSPGPVHCITSPAIKFKVKNFSTSPITTFQVVTTLNGSTPVSQNFTVNLDLDEEEIFTLNALTLKAGENHITMTLNNPNGLPDSQPLNNTTSFNSNLDQSTDSAPLRMTFDSQLEVPWITATPTPNAQGWEGAITTKKISTTYKAYSNPTLGEEAWFVSPVLDLTQYKEQSLFFDLSYAQRIPREDRLKILASTDCGGTYDKVLFDETGSIFQNITSSSEWVPSSSNDWSRQRVSLDTISGIKNVRIAFVAVNANGNNIYLDNIEIFAGDDPNPPVSSLSYQFYYPPDKPQYNVALTFTLPEKKDVRLQILSLMGQVVTDTSLPDTLNQTYYFDLSTQTAGIYLFRLQIDDQFSTTKVFVGH